MEKDFAPLSQACVRALNDKMYEKRKAAALEIEKMVKEFAALNNTTQIKRLLKILGQDFAVSKNPHSRKGGLIGLAAMAVGLGKETANYIEDLIHPILANFCEADSRVRFYACESLYNVVKIARSSILPYFAEIFSALSKLAADPDQHVKNGSELLDRLLKDIVTECTSFNIDAFMPLLRERIYVPNNFARQFIISWISVLNSVPDIDLIPYLPEILDGLFNILADPTVEINKMCETLLGEFLRNIKLNPEKANFPEMINVLIVHAQSSDSLLQYTAVTWIKEFVQLSRTVMLPHVSGILTAILLCVAYEEDSQKHIKETAIAVNFSLMKLITMESKPNQEGEEEGENKLNLPSVVEVLSKNLQHTPIATKVAVLRWIYHLYTKTPKRMYPHIDELFPILLKVLSDPSDEVVQHDLEVLAQIVSTPPHQGNGVSEKNDFSKPVPTLVNKLSNNVTTNPYFYKFITSLLKLFLNRSLLEDRGSFIIRQLCVLLNSEDIYCTLAKIILEEDNIKFASVMVQSLNTILLTSSELFQLRNSLKDFKTEDSYRLFETLYATWCHSPVATFALCLLTQNYEHASELLRIFGDIEITTEFLVEVDKLVQLIESPIFTYLRIELLEVPHNRYLVQALYGLLMLLPQSNAFHTLKNRLQCIPQLQFFQANESEVFKKKESIKKSNLDFKKLLQTFVDVQERHKQIKSAARYEALLEKGVKNTEIS